MKTNQLHEILPNALLKHALKIREKYKTNPEYAAHYLKEFLSKSEYHSANDPYINRIKGIIEELKVQAESEQTTPLKPPIDEKESLKRAISEYYLRQQLVNAILERGEIPTDPVETWIGVGFIDIADYSYISKWLSPKENQVVLNGLYSALKTVLDKRGGYLNKMEGDSLMFQYGGMIDPQLKGLSVDQVKSYIARESFYTCIEMQNVCLLFNKANKDFLNITTDDETKQSLFDAFNIISNLRENLSFASAINALFQIRIRIGANIGEVCIGNFGPFGAKQWDIIGVPVIDAKRMESTAPVGGLRISEELYGQLEADGITDIYLHEFRAKARENGGQYQTIEKEEIFKFSEVTLKDKKSRHFRTYSVQVDPELPETLMSQTKILLTMGKDGTNKIIEILQYYRGNKYVIQAMEDSSKTMSVNLRKDLILQAINNKIYEKIVNKFENNTEQIKAYIDRRYTLYSLFQFMGRIQDYLKHKKEGEDEELPEVPFLSFDEYLEIEKINIQKNFIDSIRTSVRRHQFFNKIFPLVFLIIKSALIELQNKREDVETLIDADVSA